VTPDHEPLVSDDLEGDVRRDQLDRALPRISFEHKAVIVSRNMLDVPLEQVADAQDVSVGTVGSRSSGRALEGSEREAVEALHEVIPPGRLSGPARIVHMD
jgi:DNA-directed RNA polymerase specialized sigma24 family protein